MEVKSPPEPRALTFAEVGELVGASERQIRRWCDEGKLGYVRLPQGRRVRPAQVAAFLDANEVDPLKTGRR